MFGTQKTSSSVKIHSWKFLVLFLDIFSVSKKNLKLPTSFDLEILRVKNWKNPNFGKKLSFLKFRFRPQILQPQQRLRSRKFFLAFFCIFVVQKKFLKLPTSFDAWFLGLKRRKHPNFYHQNLDFFIFWPPKSGIKRSW